MDKFKGPILLFLGSIIVLGIIFFGKNFLFDKNKQDSSDSNINVKNIKGAGDSYLGYGFIHTLEFKKQLARKGLSVKYNDDGGNYAERLEKFSKKEYDFIMLPVNSYIEHGAKYNYPGKVVAVISESKGADAIVGFEDVLKSGKINDLNNSDLKVWYTSASPSSFLLDLTISDFALDDLQNTDTWRNEAK